jgi:iron complex outermembrane recepter protein
MKVPTGFLSILFFMWITAPAYAQGSCEAILHGKITDEESHELIGATIYIPELNKGTVADHEGHFDLKGLCNGTYIVRVQHLGHETVERSVTIENYTEIVMRLHTEDIALEQITVTDTRLVEATQASSTLSGQALEKTRGLSLGEALRNISGVTTLQTGPNISKPIIRGLHSNRILIMNNGIRQEAQQWGAEHAPEIDPFVASEITVIKGAAGVRYGSDAIAGVILLEPKKLPEAPGMWGSVNLVGMSNGRQGVGSGTLEGNIAQLDGLQWRLQGTAKRAGNMQTPGYYIENSGSRETNYSATLQYHKETWGANLFYSHFGSQVGIYPGTHSSRYDFDTQEFFFPTPSYTTAFTYAIDRPYQDINHNLLKFKGYLKTGSAGTLNLVYGFQHNYRSEWDVHGPRRRSNRNLDLPEISYNLSTNTADLFWEHTPYKNFTGSFGVSGIAQYNQYRSLSINPIIPNYDAYTASAFALERWTKNKWELEGGLRYDYRVMGARLFQGREVIPSSHHFNNLSFASGAIYRLAEEWQAKLNISSAWRPPSPNEMFSNGLHHGIGAIEVGNINFKPERAFNTIATLSHTGNRFSFEVSGYNNYINNFIYMRPAPEPRLTIRGLFRVINFEQVEAAVLRGIDFQGGYTLTNALSVSSKTSLLWARDRNSGQYLEMMPSNRIENAVRYSFRTTQQVKEPFISISHLYVDRQRRLPTEVTDPALPPAAYSLFNTEAGFELPLRGHAIGFSLSVYNVFNTRYREYLNMLRYYTDEPGRNVVFRIKIPFTVFEN